MISAWLDKMLKDPIVGRSFNGQRTAGFHPTNSGLDSPTPYQIQCGMTCMMYDWAKCGIWKVPRFEWPRFIVWEDNGITFVKWELELTTA